MVVYIEHNPFFIIGASTRDDRHKIVALAEEQGLAANHEACSKARSDLTSPRNRLTAEISWLPGVSPKRAGELISLIHQNPETIPDKEDNIPSLAFANLMSSAFEVLDETLEVEVWVKWITNLAISIDKIDPSEVLRDINEDRSVSGFSPVKGIESIEAELVERKRYYKDSIKSALDRLPSLKLLDVVTKTVDTVTHQGEQQAPTLINEVVDSFALGIQSFLLQGAENILKLSEYIKTTVSHGEDAVIIQITKLEELVLKWDKFAQPIQVSMKSRGMEHDISRDVAYGIRDLGIYLANEHRMIRAASKTTQILKDAFSELRELAGRVEEDAQTLDELFESRNKSQQEQDEWAKEISYETDIGAVFKDRFSISPKGISWRGDTFPLESITNVRWGGVRHSVNGIPTGTTYTVGFGTNTRSAAIELRKQEIYSTIIDKLWRAVGIRIMTDLLEALKAGKKLNFSDAVVQDTGVEVTTHKFFKNERVYLNWSQLQVWSQGGSFFIGSKDDKKSYSDISYIDCPNAHILESFIRMAFKKGCGKNISGLLG